MVVTLFSHVTLREQSQQQRGSAEGPEAQAGKHELFPDYSGIRRAALSFLHDARSLLSLENNLGHVQGTSLFFVLVCSFRW